MFTVNSVKSVEALSSLPIQTPFSRTWEVARNLKVIKFTDHHGLSTE